MSGSHIWMSVSQFLSLTINLWGKHRWLFILVNWYYFRFFSLIISRSWGFNWSWGNSRGRISCPYGYGSCGGISFFGVLFWWKPSDTLSWLSNRSRYFILSRPNCVLLDSRMYFISVLLTDKLTIFFFITENKFMRWNRWRVVLPIPRYLLPIGLLCTVRRLFLLLVPMLVCHVGTFIWTRSREPLFLNEGLVLESLNFRSEACHWFDNCDAEFI